MKVIFLRLRAFGIWPREECGGMVSLLDMQSCLSSASPMQEKASVGRHFHRQMPAPLRRNQPRPGGQQFTGEGADGSSVCLLAGCVSCVKCFRSMLGPLAWFHVNADIG